MALTIHEARGVGVATLTRQWMGERIFCRLFSISGHGTLETMLGNTLQGPHAYHSNCTVRATLKWLERMCRFGPSTFCSSPRRAGFYGSSTRSLTMLPHIDGVYSALR